VYLGAGGAREGDEPDIEADPDPDPDLEGVADKGLVT
jgi:hypothetical protein